MQFLMFLISVTLFSVFCGSGSASTFYARQSLPSCAVPCIENAQYGDCSPQDNVCMCQNSNFIYTITACIESLCAGSDLTNAEQYSQAICRSVGVTLTSSVVLTGTWASIAASETSATATPITTGLAIYPTSPISTQWKPVLTARSFSSDTAQANAATSVRLDALPSAAIFGLVVLALVL